MAGCQRTERVGADRTVSIALSEYRLAPGKVRATAGLLTFVVHNYGRLTHNLAVTQNGQADGATTPIPPGSTAELTVDLPAGTYSLVSTLFEDQSLGLHGTLTVTG
jgi:plastocyanin